MGVMSSVAIPEISVETEPRSPQALGPLWMTGAFCLALVAFTALGILRRITGSEPDYSHHAITYSSQILGAWLLLCAALSTIYHRRTFLRESLQRNARPWKVEAARGFAVYVAIAVGFVAMRLLWAGGTAGHIMGGADHRLHVTHTASMQLAPASLSDLLLWTIVSFSAAFCEEVMFRGYLLRQCIAALQKMGQSQRAAAATSVVLTAFLFGMMHLYEGAQSALLIALLGATYAVVALRSGNLRTVIVAHFFQDLLFGIFYYFTRLG
jgi:hypothetical protein